MELKVGMVCDRGLNPKRPVNQDSFLCVPQHGLFAVFDGVGGQRAGEVASSMAAETVEESLENITAASSHDLIKRAIKFANRDIYERAEGEPEYQSMATTVALVHLADHRATIAHVGDSRVYRLEEGYFYRETIDHTDVNDDLRAGLLPELGGAKNRNVINRALGAEPDVEVEVKTIIIPDGARFLLCSDGIYRHMPDEEIAGVLAQTKDPQRAADELKRIVLSRGADDNLTAIVVQVGRAHISNVIAIDDGMSAYLNQQPISARAVRQASAAQKSSAAPSSPVEATSRGSAKNRIEVAFNSDEEQAQHAPWPESEHQRYDFDETPSKPRIWLWTLVFLVSIIAAFYLGLRMSEWKKQATSEQPEMSETAKQMKTAREAIEKGESLTAVNLLAAIIGREPQNVEARYWLGRAHLEQGEYLKARENFEEAIKGQPKIADFYLYAAVAQKALGNRARADEMLEQYVELRKVQQLTQQPNR
jgi:serine/threonine protein phosphatase PrpC/TolA-binding protein